MFLGPVALSLYASVLFGLALVLTQFGLQFHSPRQGAAMSVPTSAVLFLVLALFRLDFRTWDTYAACLFAAAGLLLGFVTLLTFESNRRMGPSITAALGNLAPLFAITLAIALFSETPRPTQALGIVVTVAGVIFLSTNRTWLDVRWSPWLMALPLAAAVLRGIVQPMAKLGFATWNSPTAAAMIGYTGSATIVIGSALCERPAQSLQRSYNGYFWFILVGLSNGCATLAMYAALSRGTVTLVSPLVATYPVVTVAMTAAMIRKSRMTGQLVCGVVITVIGVVVLISS
jgi:drug/metabolite transporter (DMT)-like permease